MRSRVATIHPNTASHTIRKRDSSSVQISGSPTERVSAPSDTTASSATTSAQQTNEEVRSKAPATTRYIGGRLRGGDKRSAPRGRSDQAVLRRLNQVEAMRSHSPLPHFDSNLAGTLASTGLRKLSMSGWITVMPAVLNVSASLLSCARISLSCVWPCVSPADLSDCRSLALSACHAASFTTIRRGVMMCPVSTRYFCTSKNLLLWIVGSGFSWPS